MATFDVILVSCMVLTYVVLLRSLFVFHRNRERRPRAVKVISTNAAKRSASDYVAHRSEKAERIRPGMD